MEPLPPEEQEIPTSVYQRPKHQVFINCPFDDDYKALLFEPMVFTIQACGFTARCALEEGLENDRFTRIQELIEECPISIHDLSRNRVGDNPRFNMPLELGLFIGCKRYGGVSNANKSYLVLDREKYQYQKYISDINGKDPKIHEDSPLKLISIIRDWLSDYYRVVYPGQRLKVPSGTNLFGWYRNFFNDKQSFCQRPEIDLDHTELTYVEQRDIITEWWMEKRRTYELMQIAMQSTPQAMELIANQQVNNTESE